MSGIKRFIQVINGKITYYNKKPNKIIDVRKNVRYNVINNNEIQ